MLGDLSPKAPEDLAFWTDFMNLEVLIVQFARVNRYEKAWLNKGFRQNGIKLHPWKGREQTNSN